MREELLAQWRDTLRKKGPSADASASPSPPSAKDDAYAVQQLARLDVLAAAEKRRTAPVEALLEEEDEGTEAKVRRTGGRE